jgi:hypothetical protein
MLWRSESTCQRTPEGLLHWIEPKRLLLNLSSELQRHLDGDNGYPDSDMSMGNLH